ncbi:MAG TPA: hypothetical protein VL261_14965 [Nitrospira sp.]|nr:hypothetical protein [Nitrospira sp.]
MKTAIVILAAWASAACGVMGIPIPPEDVGVAPLIERQKKLDALDAKKREAEAAPPEPETQGQDVELPDLRPVGTR